MKNTILLVGVLSLAACSPTHDDLNMWIKQTQDEAKVKVTPFQAPTITPPVAYTPPAYNGLNAFVRKKHWKHLVWKICVMSVFCVVITRHLALSM